MAHTTTETVILNLDMLALCPIVEAISGGNPTRAWAVTIESTDGFSKALKLAMATLNSNFLSVMGLANFMCGFHVLGLERVAS